VPVTMWVYYSRLLWSVDRVGENKTSEVSSEPPVRKTSEV